MGKHFCITCKAMRLLVSYRCIVCGEPVRLRPVWSTASMRRKRGVRQLEMPGWHGLAWAREEKERAA